MSAWRGRAGRPPWWPIQIRCRGRSGSRCRRPRRLRASSAYCGSRSTSLAMASAVPSTSTRTIRQAATRARSVPAQPGQPCAFAHRVRGSTAMVRTSPEHHRRDDLRAQPDPRCRHHRRSGAEQEDEPPAQPRRGAGGGLRPRADRAGSRHGPTVGPTLPSGPRPRRMRRAGRTGVIVGRPGRRPGLGR